MMTPISLNLRSIYPSRVHHLGVLVLKLSFLPKRFLQNGRSSTTHPLQSTILLSLQEFDILNQINGPLTSSSINDRYILWDFSAFTLFYPPECSVPGIPDLAPRVRFQINDCHILWDFSLWRSQISTTTNIWSESLWSVRSSDTCSSMIQ
jgi:hypothetical protein